jgi:hypothetical protein
MILTGSPFYYNTVFANTYVTRMDYVVVVGTGSTTTVAPIETYELSKLKPSSTATNTWLDLSPFARDLFVFAPIDFTGIAANVVQASGTYEVLISSVTADTVDTIGSEVATASQKYIATSGYGYYRDGQNLQPSQKIMLSHTEYKADYRGYFIVPLRCATGDGNPTVNAVSVSLSFTDTNTNYIKYLVIPCANYTGVITVAFEGEEITIELVTE